MAAGCTEGGVGCIGDPRNKSETDGCPSNIQGRWRSVQDILIGPSGKGGNPYEAE